MSLTIHDLMQAAEAIKKIEQSTGKPLIPAPFHDIPVIESHSALAETTERTFPVSRHRSARIHKKLVKRFGGEFKKEPAIFHVQGRIYAHPARYVELRRMFAEARS